MRGFTMTLHPLLCTMRSLPTRVENNRWMSAYYNLTMRHCIYVRIRVYNSVVVSNKRIVLMRVIFSFLSETIREPRGKGIITRRVHKLRRDTGSSDASVLTSRVELARVPRNQAPRNKTEKIKGRNKVHENVLLPYYKQQMSSFDHEERRQPTTLLWADLTQY